MLWSAPNSGERGQSTHAHKNNPTCLCGSQSEYQPRKLLSRATQKCLTDSPDAGTVVSVRPVCVCWQQRNTQRCSLTRGRKRLGRWNGLGGYVPAGGTEAFFSRRCNGQTRTTTTIACGSVAAPKAHSQTTNGAMETWRLPPKKDKSALCADPCSTAAVDGSAV